MIANGGVLNSEYSVKIFFIYFAKSNYFPYSAKEN